MHLDALCLKDSHTVAQAKADFSKLPYFDGKTDQNSDHAYISEEIISQPFADQRLILNPGIHLHWALPDGLTGTMSMPLVYKESFVGVFGPSEGLKIWQHLHEINWLNPFAGKGFWATIPYSWAFLKI